jgi:hypothetical protein
MHKLVKLLGIGFFFGMLTLGYVGMLNGPDEKSIRLAEQRAPFSRFPEQPDFSSKKILRCISFIERALNDRICLKYYLLRAYSFLCYGINDSAFPQKVIKGKNDWLFLGNYYNSVVDGFLGLRNISEHSLEYSADRIVNIQNISNDRRIQFVYVIAPNKHAIYSDYLPEWANKSDISKRPENILEARLKEKNVNVVNLTCTLKKAHQDHPQVLLYYKQDTHWNRAGAYFAYAKIMSRLKMKNENIHFFGNFFFLESISQKNSGDLKNFLLQPHSKEFTDDSFVWFPGVSPNSTYSITSGEQTIKLRASDPWHVPFKKTVDKVNNPFALNKLKLLFIRDSFGAALHPYMVNTFSEVIIIHNGAVAHDLKRYADLITEHNPDVIIYEIVARQTL